MINFWPWLIFAAILIFWAIGARNRLLRMRHEIDTCFDVVNTQFQERQELLIQWLENLRPLVGNHSPEWLAVKAASQQLDIAREHLHTQVGAASLAASFRIAEETLATTRSRLAVLLPARAVDASLPQPSVTESLFAADSTLAFARHAFNRATQSYNQALLEFPTSMISGIFGFQVAGTI